MAYDELKWAVDSVKKFGEGFLPKNMNGNFTRYSQA